MNKTIKKSKDRIFITGGTGFIGAHVARELLDMGDDVCIYDSFKNYVSPLANPNYPLYLKERYKLLDDRAEIIEGDVRDLRNVSVALESFQPTKIVHLVALPIADKSNKLPQEAVSVNYNGTVNMLDAAHRLPSLKKFINTSSSMVYGDFQYSPCDEEHQKVPHEVYGATKYGAEIMVRMYAKRFGFSYIIIRPSAVYGPTDCNRRVSQIFVDKALNNEPLTLHNMGRSKLDFTYIDDIVQGIVLATKNDDVNNETFNITRGEGRSLSELAEIVKEHIPSVELTYEEAPEDEKRPERGAMSIEKARKLLGYDPKYSLEVGMEKYIKFVRELNERK